MSIRRRPARHAALAVLALSAALAAAPASASESPSDPADAPPAAAASGSAPVTAHGTRFFVPDGWTLRQDGARVWLDPPEGDSTLALVDVEAADATAAVEAAWAAIDAPPRWPLKLASAMAARDGWESLHYVDYEVPATAGRVFYAYALGKGGRWTVVLVDLPQAVQDKRGAQLGQLFGRLLPAGYERESFVGRAAHPLDAARLETLRGFVRDAMRELGVPGVAVGIVQDGRTVLSEGFGVRRLGDAAPVTPHTLFPIASNTKPMSTLLLGRLVDAGRLRWDMPVTEVYPAFRLGDPATTAKVRIEHLVCACTGLPRQDFEWIMEFEGLDADGAMRTLATMQPTSEFGALFQYSNALAAAAGYVGAYRLHPEMELGAAYDRAMREEVFAPLGMDATTFDFDAALAADHAAPHGWDVDGRTVLADFAPNGAAVPMRPAGGAWSHVEDLLRYVRMELARGVGPDGERVVSEAVIDARRAAKVAAGNDVSYGMGLQTDLVGGVEIVHHGGSLFGYQSDMLWLPAHGVGAVVLTNSGEGRALVSGFRRRLLEVLFDGEARAWPQLQAYGETGRAWYASERATLTLPADPQAAAALAPAYRNDALGRIDVIRDGDGLRFDFGAWSARMASRSGADGSQTFYMVAPNLTGLEFIVDGDGLLFRTPQRDYRFGVVD
ncbi:serine hydrolase domain-containing protein [Arenimonas composti]|uniref:Beta-lactamase-related domain-containing protein n=1 Tax=Arenimonas composti TR7-09 = DSM 18010 TaxID=1121013 RepID=A0A091BXA6_9GAMM|nr:serine hydrolase domain-containing protein [Arenimonas composti]KFN48960.1 hypothetical protein P873_01270 [Arenimonas composti TR7-09 = DSM 18010]